MQVHYNVMDKAALLFPCLKPLDVYVIGTIGQTFKNVFYCTAKKTPQSFMDLSWVYFSLVLQM